MHHIESQGIICETQFGFRQKHSCETQLLLTIDDFARALDHNNQVNVGILDMSKAFDKIPHERLALKLHHYGIRGNVLTWLQSFLEVDLNRWCLMVIILLHVMLFQVYHRDQSWVPHYF